MEEKRKPPKKKAANLSIKAILRIGKTYNAVNKTQKQYGEMVHIIENTNVDRCVCCGEVVPEGKMVCPLCESQVNE